MVALAEIEPPSVTAAAPVDINNWMIRDDDRDSHIIVNNGPLLVPAGGALVLGRNGDPSQNGGYHADYVYSGINLANSDDEIVLVDPTGQIVDRVAYTGIAPWPSPAGMSIRLMDLSSEQQRRD